MNHEIRAKEIRLILEDGEMFGVISTFEALGKARAIGLDLVEIVPQSVPPVCKIINYGKYKYEMQKKQQVAKKNQKIVEIKEVKFRPNIGKNDYDVKLRSIIKFIQDDQNKVKVSLRYRGREMMHSNLGMEIMLRIKADTTEIAKVDMEPKMEDRQLIMMLSPIVTI